MNELVGYLIIANIGTIVAVAIGIIRLVWTLSKLHSKLEKTSDDVDAAHGKIRDLEKIFIERGI